jgi:hypothetical protein
MRSPSDVAAEKLNGPVLIVDGGKHLFVYKISLGAMTNASQFAASFAGKLEEKR